MAENNNEKLRIRLHVYDMNIPVNIKPEDEKELLYMALIEIALRYEMQLKRNDTEPFRDILNKLTSEIEDAIKE